MNVETLCEPATRADNEFEMPELWQRVREQWDGSYGAVWYRQSGVWSNGLSLHVNFQTNQELNGATLVTTVDGGAMNQRRWRESPATLIRAGKGWKVSAAMPPRITAWFLYLKSGDQVTCSDLMDLG